MPFVPVENVALVELRMEYDGQQVENTLYFAFPGAIDGTMLTDLCTEMKGWWAASYASVITDQVTLREVVATDLTTATSGQSSVSGGGETGDFLAVGMPGNVSLSVSFRTDFRGRSFRGRNFLVGIPISQVEDISQVIAGYETGVLAAYNAVFASATAQGVVWSVVSRFSGVDPVTHAPIPRVAGVPTPITSVILVDRTLDGMRQRLPGRGR
jgi:hypothetical protein